MNMLYNLTIKPVLHVSNKLGYKPKITALKRTISNLLNFYLRGIKGDFKRQVFVVA